MYAAFEGDVGTAVFSAEVALKLLAIETIDSDCVDEMERFEFERRNLGRKDIRAASTVDEGVIEESDVDIPEVREPVAKETFE